MKDNLQFAKVYFVDQTSERDHHMVFNASMIKILMLLFPEASLSSCGIQTNQDSVKQLLSAEEQQKVRFIPISNPKIKSNNTLLKGLNYIRKEFIRFSVFRQILKKREPSELIFLSITTFTAFALFKFIKQFYRTPVIAVLHGDIDFLYFPASRLDKINAAVHKWIFRKKLPDFKYLLLNKIAKSTLVKDGYLKEDEVYEINHPFTFLNHSAAPATIGEGTIKIGHIGSMEVERKNSHYIYTLAAQFGADVDAGSIQFRVAGLITPGVIPYKNKWVHEVVGNEDPAKPQYLTRAQYEKELEILDYSIFFYPPHQYVFRASGAVIDIINGLIPVITLRHPFFDYLFAAGGNIGFICNDLSEMEALIRKIADKDASVLGQYQEQQKNIQRLQEQFSVEAIATDLKRQLALYSLKTDS